MSVVERYNRDGVRVFRLDRERVVAELARRAEALLSARPNVREVRLFGSLARGDAGPGSDADLIVVLTEEAAQPDEQPWPLARAFEGLGIGCDVIAYRESELARLIAEGQPFVRRALRESVVLAER